MRSLLGLHPHGSGLLRNLRYALAVWASPSRLALCARGSGFTARALPLRLALCARCLDFTLVVLASFATRATRSQFGLRPRGSRYALAAQVLPSRLALRTRSSRYALATRASPSRHVLRACSTSYALAARYMRLPLGLRPRGLR